MHKAIVRGVPILLGVTTGVLALACIPFVLGLYPVYRTLEHSEELGKKFKLARLDSFKADALSLLFAHWGQKFTNQEFLQLLRKEGNLILQSEATELLEMLHKQGLVLRWTYVDSREPSSRVDYELSVRGRYVVENPS